MLVHVRNGRLHLKPSTNGPRRISPDAHRSKITFKFPMDGVKEGATDHLTEPKHVSYATPSRQRPNRQAALPHSSRRVPLSHPLSPALPSLLTSTEEAQPTESAKPDINSELENASDEASAIIIFQCGQCRNIVSDTSIAYQFSGTCDIVHLHAACHVVIDDPIITSEAGIDNGCAFRRVICQECRSVLGRVYISTIPKLDNWRNLFTLETDRLVTFRLGDCRDPCGKLGRRADGVHLIPLAKTGKKKQESKHPSLEAFTQLQGHVGQLNDAVNVLTDAMRESRTAILELQSGLETTARNVADGEVALGHVHKLMLVWDERVRKIDTCDTNVAQITSAVQTMEKRIQIFQDRAGRNSNPPRITGMKRSSSSRTPNPRSKSARPQSNSK